MNVRSVFRAAVRDGLIATDPTVRVRLPRQRKREASMAIPTPETVRRIMEAADPRFRAFVGLCALAGLRLGEAAALQVDDVDFLRREIHVRRQVQRVNGGEVDIRLPKYNSERTIHAAQALIDMLAEHVALGLDQRVALRGQRQASTSSETPSVIDGVRRSPGPGSRVCGCTTFATSMRPV